jgi:Ser/Thr protein kinase RdoA (MazF antagonist)
MFEWVRGRSLRGALTPARAAQLGRVSARLHELGAAHAPAIAPDVPVADPVLYSRLGSRLDELWQGYGSMPIEALDRAQRAIDALWSDPPHPPHLLHGDIVDGNVLVFGENLAVIVFQDLFWGFEAQVLAITIAHLEHEGDEIVDSFRAGYRAVRPWPDLDGPELAALVTARRLQQLNFGLHVRTSGLEDFVRRNVRLVAKWMRSAG